MSIRRKWAVCRAEIDKEIQWLRDSRLAGARLKGRRPNVGLQAFESNSPVHVNDTVPELNSGHCVLGVLPPDHVTEFNSRFSANLNQNVLLDALGTVNHPNQSLGPGELVHGIESGIENHLISTLHSTSGILLLGNADAPNLVVSPTPMQLMQGQPKKGPIYHPNVKNDLAQGSV
ncbi:hypothetical protein B0H10DRAFT_1941277 [Mycena sp. CBHHK59/15]|nr:hypothetical protein B0H10DRAFT_1941277 [Mycena sp. CBHHK59/15]